MADAKLTDNRKAELLSTPVEHIDITKFDARPIIDAWGKMSFTSRDAARAAQILNMALEDQKCSTWMAGYSAEGDNCRVPGYSSPTSEFSLFSSAGMVER